ncbi:hypothetical protein JCM10207_003561 [Rhodosporidiobolus poonsookiae]
MATAAAGDSQTSAKKGSADLPSPPVLVATDSSHGTATGIFELDIDWPPLLRHKKRDGTTDFNAPFPAPFGDSHTTGPWHVQILAEDSAALKLRVWRRSEDKPLVLALLMRLFASSNGVDWVTPGSKVASSKALRSEQNNKAYDICTLDLTPADLTEPDKSRLWSREYRLEVSFLYDTELYKSSQVPRAEAFVQPLRPLVSTLRTPYNVRLFFPQAKTERAELWLSSSALAAASPYFHTLLQSNFAEATTEHTEETPPSLDDSHVDPEYDDSDDEADTAITVRGSWSTFRALAAYLQTGNVVFAPLRSSRSTKFDLAAHRAKLRTAYSANPNKPLPVSPKLLYRLSHHLDLPALSALCLRDFRRQLSPQNGVIKLFSDVAAAYDNLCEVALAYTVKRWADINDSAAMKEMKVRIKSGEMTEAAPVLIELLERVEEKRDELFLRRIRSGGVTLLTQTSLPADVAIYNFDIDAKHFHSSIMPGTGRTGGWRGSTARFSSSTSSEHRPWNMLLRFQSWNTNYDRSLGIWIWKDIPERSAPPVEPVKVKDETAPGASSGESRNDSTSTRADEQDGAPPDLRGTSDPYFMAHPALPPKTKTIDYDDDLNCDPFYRNALLVQMRLFSKSYDEGAGNWELVDSTIQTQQSIRKQDPNKEVVEMKVSGGKLQALRKTTSQTDKTKSARWLRLEVTTIFNHNAAKDLWAVQPERGDIAIYGVHHDVNLRKAPHDLRLWFPDIGKLGAELWTSSKFLKAMSPYYEDLFSSGFADRAVLLRQAIHCTGCGVPRRQQQRAGEYAGRCAAGSAHAAPAEGPKDDGDSDNEADALVIKHAPQILKARDADVDFEYRQVTIRGIAWSTYRAVLLYAATGDLVFGNIRSYTKGHPLKSGFVDLEKWSLDRLTSENHNPLPVSPRSVYKLAHLLQMDDLAVYALDHYRAQLTVDNAAKELFSTTSERYNELKAAAKQFCGGDQVEIGKSPQAAVRLATNNGIQNDNSKRNGRAKEGGKPAAS